MSQQPPNYGQPDPAFNQPPPYQNPPGYQPSYQPPKKTGGCLKIGGIAALVVLALIVLASVMSMGKSGTSTTKASFSYGPVDGKSEAAKPAATETSAAAEKPAESAAPASTKPSATGNSVTVEMRSGTATATVYGTKWTTAGLVAPKNGAYLVIDIGFVGDSGSFTYNPLYLKVKDADGREYNLAFGSNASPVLGSGDISTGQKARGFVAYDVPRGPVTLIFSNELLQDTGAEIQIPG